MCRRLALVVFCLIALSVSSLSFGVPRAEPPRGIEGQLPSGTAIYVVLMEQPPAVAYDGGVKGLTSTRPAGKQKIRARSAEVQRYARHLIEGHDAALKAVGVNTAAKTHDYTIALNGFAAVLTEEQARKLSGAPGVFSVQRDTLRHKATDSSPEFLGLTDADGPWASGLLGEGIVIGVIDTGIWPEHPSFADDGSYAAPPVIVGVCDFGNITHNPNDAPFTCNDKLIGARQMLDSYRVLIGADPDEFDSARDDDGHGSFDASIAAGNAGVAASILGIPRGTVAGIAPRAHIVAYKALGNLGGFSSDLAAAIDRAVLDGVDVIIYGANGGASLTGADDLALLFAADAGVHVAVPAANSGPGAGTIGGPGSVPWVTAVGADTQMRSFEGATVLGNGAVFVGISITTGTSNLPLVDAAVAGDELCIPGSLTPATVAGKIVLCRRGAIGRVPKSEAVFLAGGAGMILYNNSDIDDSFSDTHWVPSVHVDNTAGLAIKAYIGSTASPTARIDGGIPGVFQGAPSITSFSVRGPDPVALDIIKPDIVAPGISVLAAYSPFPDAGQFPGELFQAGTGTSASAAHVGGVMALVAQAHPTWSSAMVKSALMTTANPDVRDSDKVSPADPFDMGAGQLDPGGPLADSPFDPGLVYDAGFLDYLGFLCEAEPSAFSDPVSTCAALESSGVPVRAADLNLPSIGVSSVPGARTIQRSVTSVAPDADANANGQPDTAEDFFSVATLQFSGGQALYPQHAHSTPPGGGAITGTLAFLPPNVGLNALDVQVGGSILFAVNNIGAVQHTGGVTLLRPGKVYRRDIDGSIVEVAATSSLALSTLDALDESNGHVVSVERNQFHGGQFLWQQNGYRWDPTTEILSLEFDGVAWGLQTLDCIELYPAQPTRVGFSVSRLQPLWTSAGVQMLYPQRMYVLDTAAWSVQEAISVPGVQSLDACSTGDGIEPFRWVVSVEPPPGYDVSVTPSEIVLNENESASYTVDFLVTTAPPDVWRFGSLTWSSTDGRYAVRSPIAVLGSTFLAPEEIDATGTSGSAGFDVHFGYSGSYSAEAHGLEPAVITSDNVLQDPDQFFDPSDVSGGGANLHQFVLSGAAVLRVALTDVTVPNADLDLYVYDPANNQVASATSGISDEILEFLLPADGTWGIYVHGWSVPGGNTNYELSTWIVSATPGGSLSVDSAPASATLGQTGTIGVSWSGLAAPGSYLGAVSHADASGLLGFTMIAVETP